ncbi:FHA domain-containing protein [Bifidobacterium stellenboschense]|uniref:Putative FHA domain protein n=1 Tax=Bifidobacterium stellenboschense TaxID=762211 RepID=A0A087DWX3_9BIFI|nr:FHA domain-containing protein [Bifidobacterium stellenboschense]KFJ00024.1 putative FHA domain protein [Bifidobacterium stellenboschense]
MKVRIVKNRQAGSQTLTVTATRGEELDYAHAQWLGMGRMAMLAFRYEANDRETLCYYDVTGSVPLADVARSGMNDTIYMGALLSAAAVLGECESQGIAVVCVLWEPKHVFVGPDGGVRFALVPLFGADAGRKNTIHALLTFLADSRRVRLQSPNGIGLQQALGGFLAQNPTVSAALLNGFLTSMGLIAPAHGAAQPSFTQASSPTQAASPTVAGGTRPAVDNDPFGATVVGDATAPSRFSSRPTFGGSGTSAQSPLQQLRGVADMTGGTGSGFTGSGFSYTGTGSYTGATGPTESFGPRPTPQPVVSDETVASTLPRHGGETQADETVASVLPRHTAAPDAAQNVAAQPASPTAAPAGSQARPASGESTGRPVKPVQPAMPAATRPTNPAMPTQPAPQSTPMPKTAPTMPAKSPEPQPERRPARDFSAMLNGDKPRPTPAYKPVIRTNPAATPRTDGDDSEGETSLFGATEHDGFEVTRLRDGRTLTATGAIARKATIGRSKTADLHMGGNTNVSRVHATIEVMDDGRFAITDNDSANGTSVRGREMASGGTEYLSSGEDFALADDTFIIRAL